MRAAYELRGRLKLLNDGTIAVTELGAPDMDNSDCSFPRNVVVRVYTQDNEDIEAILSIIEMARGDRFTESRYQASTGRCCKSPSTQISEGFSFVIVLRNLIRRDAVFATVLHKAPENSLF